MPAFLFYITYTHRSLVRENKVNSCGTPVSKAVKAILFTLTSYEVIIFSLIQMIPIYFSTSRYVSNNNVTCLTERVPLCIHILTSTILAVLFVSPSKIALDKFYVYCPPPPPPPTVRRIYAPASNFSYYYQCWKKLCHFNFLWKLSFILGGFFEEQKVQKNNIYYWHITFITNFWTVAYILLKQCW